MLKPSRLNFILSLAIAGLALWLWHIPPPTPWKDSFEPGLLIIDHLNVFDALRPHMELDRRLVIHDGLIQEIGSSGGKIPPGARLLNGKSLCVLPGLIDASVFASLDGALPEDRSAPNFQRTLKIQMLAGVTFLADLNSSQAQASDSDRGFLALNRPGLLLAGAVLTSPGGWRPGSFGDGASPVEEISDAEGLQRAFKNLRQRHCQIVFASVEHLDRGDAGLSEDLLLRLGQQCRLFGLVLIIHAEHTAKAMTALAANPDILVGPWADAPAPPELIQAMLKGGCSYAPALESFACFHPVHDLEPVLRGMAEPGWISASLLDSLTDWPRVLQHAKLDIEPVASEKIAEDNVLALRAAGIPLVMASFSGMPGLPQGMGLRMELQLMEKLGLSQSQLLAMATINAANALHLGEMGQIAPGFKADLLFVQADPSLNLVNALRHLTHVMRNGRLSSLKALHEP